MSVFGMAFRIEYFRKGVNVMAASCPKPLLDAKKDAQEGVIRYDAEFAVIRDMDADGKQVGLVKR